MSFVVFLQYDENERKKPEEIAIKSRPGFKPSLGSSARLLIGNIQELRPMISQHYSPEDPGGLLALRFQA